MEDAIKLLDETDKVIELGNEGLAQHSEVDGIEDTLKAFLSANTNTETIFGRKFDKWNSGTHWRTMHRNKYATKEDLGMLQTLRGFLTEFIEDSNIELPTQQKFIKTGSVYTASRILRETLSQATQKIYIQDNYVGTRLLDILEQVLTENPELEVRLLTKNGNYRDLKPFIQELPLFQTQFPKLIVRSHNDAHGRFIIIDRSVVFTPGASLKDVGKKADLFSEVTDDKAKEELIQNFEVWWNAGTGGTQLI